MEERDVFRLVGEDNEGVIEVYLGYCASLIKEDKNEFSDDYKYKRVFSFVDKICVYLLSNNFIEFKDTSGIEGLCRYKDTLDACGTYENKYLMSDALLIHYLLESDEYGLKRFAVLFNKGIKNQKYQIL